MTPMLQAVCHRFERHLWAVRGRECPHLVRACRAWRL